MKPCRKNREPIVWFAMNSLGSPEASELVTHLQQCEGCRRYHQEILRVAQHLSSADLGVESSATDFLHKKVMIAIRKTAGQPAWIAALTEVCRASLSWRMAIPAGIALAIAIAGLMHHPEVAAPVSRRVESVQRSEIRTDLAPTFANYRAVANESLDQLDELLARQAKKPVAAPRPIRAATLALITAPD